ncbi:hypothetical protein ABTY53_01335 [Streptomyces noursei]|uniref:hypothetical protein n=1 Tax=Streptomyces noursei TaxID=1971 RepID=UPI00332160CE
MSPSFDNSCTNGHSSGAAGATTRGSGSVSGLLGQIPIGSPLNQCGGADFLPFFTDNDQINEDKPQFAGGNKFIIP